MLTYEEGLSLFLSLLSEHADTLQAYGGLKHSDLWLCYAKLLTLQETRFRFLKLSDDGSAQTQLSEALDNYKQPEDSLLMSPS